MAVLSVKNLKFERKVFSGLDLSGWRVVRRVRPASACNPVRRLMRPCVINNPWLSYRSRSYESCTR